MAWVRRMMPAMARARAEEALAAMGRADVAVQVAEQDVIGPNLTV